MALWDWQQICTFLPHRDAEQCRLQWERLLSTTWQSSESQPPLMRRRGRPRKRPPAEFDDCAPLNSKSRDRGLQSEPFLAFSSYPLPPQGNDASKSCNDSTATSNTFSSLLHQHHDFSTSASIPSSFCYSNASSSYQQGEFTAPSALFEIPTSRGIPSRRDYDMYDFYDEAFK